MDYFIAGNKLSITECERDLGFLASSDGTWYENSTLLHSKPTGLGLMKNTFYSWSDDIARIIYPTFVRPHLKFADCVWNQKLENDS